MKPSNDIYNYAKKLESMQRKLDAAPISERNRELIKDFDRACFMEALSKPRRIKLIGSLIILAQDYLRKDFDEATKEDLKDIVMKIDSREDYSPWTQHSYKAIIKKFYKWLEYGDEHKSRIEYPRIVSWLRCGLKKKDKPRIKASDILTEQEVQLLLEAAEHARDRAFISMLYELGARIGEIGGLLVKDVTRDKYGYIVDLEGKTGHRTPRIVISDPDLTRWLNIHPLKGNPDAPLWTLTGNRTKGRRATYGTFRKLVERLVSKAGIKKRVYHHLFRHTRVTHLLINKQINEAQAKVYFGWVPNSTMLSEYSHLISDDVNNAILAMHGITKGKEKESLFTPKQCPRCETVNSKDARFCQKCSSILDVKTAVDLDEERRDKEEILAEMIMSSPEAQKLLTKIAVKMGFRDKLLEAIESGAKSS